MGELQRAWERREELFDSTSVLRVFHGPGEGTQGLNTVAVDRFGDHYWVTRWEPEGPSTQSFAEQEKEIVDFFAKKNAFSIACLSRPVQGLSHLSKALYGKLPSGRFEVKEGSLIFKIQFENTRHPGLFLDHLPLRNWLVSHCRGKNILNLFAYTGSLSVAAAVGGASQVTTVDLSRRTIQWAQENFIANSLSTDHRFMAGDVFELLPRLAREKKKFDGIILDPPSFSRGKKGVFSTAKDMESLCGLAMDLLSVDGFLICSINSAQVSWKQLESALLSASHSKKMSFAVIQSISLPETFPTFLNSQRSRYLKGFILRRLM